MVKRRYPYTDDRGVTHLSASVSCDIDFKALQAAMEEEPWEADGENPEYETRRVFIGHLPSGKMYMPWATSNLLDCPVCGGCGVMRVRRKQRLVVKWRNAQSALREKVIAVINRNRAKPEGGVLEPLRSERSSRATRIVDRYSNVTCGRCGGFGAHEAYDDDLWRGHVEKELMDIGMSLESDDGSVAGVYAVESREACPEEEE